MRRRLPPQTRAQEIWQIFVRGFRMSAMIRPHDASQRKKSVHRDRGRPAAVLPDAGHVAVEFPSPRVSAIEATGWAKCPYCGAEYTLESRRTRSGPYGQR